MRSTKTSKTEKSVPVARKPMLPEAPTLDELREVVKDGGYPDMTDGRVCEMVLATAFAWWDENHTDNSCKGRPSISGEPDMRMVNDSINGVKKRKSALRRRFHIGTCMKFLSLLKTGSHFKPCADCAGVQETTVNEWLEKGKSEDEDILQNPYRAFHVAVMQIASQVEIWHVQNIGKAARLPGNVGATWSAWFLRNRYAKRWREQQDVDLTSAGEKLQPGSPVLGATAFIVVDRTSASKPDPLSQAMGGSPVEPAKDTPEVEQPDVPAPTAEDE